MWVYSSPKFRMPKASGSHPDKALSTMKVQQVTKEVRYPDGKGLYLVVSNTGAKRWMLRIMGDWTCRGLLPLL